MGEAKVEVEVKDNLDKFTEKVKRATDQVEELNAKLEEYEDRKSNLEADDLFNAEEDE